MAVSPLASAAGRNNPFGLPGANSTYGIGGANATGGYQGYQLLNPPQQPAGQQKTPTQTPVVPLPVSPATTPGAAGAPTPSAGMFNFMTDPALQQVNAMVGLSDQQAQAQALKERQQLLLQYGDPNLAAAVLGAGDPTVQAAAQNQESDMSQLGRQRDQNVQGFEQQLDPSLAFSGYKIGQEKLLGQAYQDALAKAASGAQSGLDTINGDLNAQLQQNAFQAMMAALASQGNGGGGSGPPPPPAPAWATIVNYATSPNARQGPTFTPPNVSDTSSPMYGQPNPLFNYAAAQQQGPAALAALLGKY